MKKNKLQTKIEEHDKMLQSMVKGATMIHTEFSEICKNSKCYFEYELKLKALLHIYCNFVFEQVEEMGFEICVPNNTEGVVE